MTPTISVVIPTWNRADMIGTAIRSALAQTMPPLEVLVCDDGSTDTTRKIVYELGDARIRWLAGPRGGRPSIPRNRGLRAAKGEWIAFIDSDDEWLPGKLARQLSAMAISGRRASCTEAIRVVPDDDSQNPLLGRTDPVIRLPELLLDNQVICSSVVIHRSLLDHAIGFPEQKNLTVGEDYALWLRIACLTDFDFISEPLLRYRDNPASSIRAASPDGWTQHITVVDNFAAWCRDQGSTMAVPLQLARQEIRNTKERRRAARRAQWRGRASRALGPLRSVLRRLHAAGRT
ncbi:MAG: glycosyltransferase family 2 protein [Ferrovibrio sp.]|uniref:glycosyltransferase family 2 protein n=1 Tax=Ferrovibrio sp. TaxID=1917215 RepID=UPI00391A74FB